MRTVSGHFKQKKDVKDYNCAIKDKESFVLLDIWAELSYYRKLLYVLWAIFPECWTSWVCLTCSDYKKGD